MRPIWHVSAESDDRAVIPIRITDRVKAVSVRRIEMRTTRKVRACGSASVPFLGLQP
jgi:hypothetical protein